MIFLVEDDPNDVFLLQRAMKKGNITIPVQHTENGHEAIKYLPLVNELTRLVIPFLQ